MCIYSVVEVILFLLFIYYRNGYKSVKFFYVSAALLLMLTGLHNGMNEGDLDFRDYLNFFIGNWSKYGDLDSKWGYDLEPIFAYFVRFLRIFGRYDFIYIIGTSLCFGIPFLILVKKYSVNPPLSILLLLIIVHTNVFITFFAGHRQMLATTFFELAFLIYFSETFKYKWYLFSAFIVLALFSHSSSYIVFPLVLCIYFLKVSSKKTIYVLLILSLLSGLLLTSVFDNLFTALMRTVSVFDVLDRTTHYTLENVYENANTTIVSLGPLTILSLICVYYSSEKEFKSFPFKSFYIGTILKNFFGFLPLINRGLLFLFLISISCAIPKALNTNPKCKFAISFIVLVNLFLAFRAYSKPDYVLLPFHFIFE